ncbi:hypothetical protein TNCV_687141 [Trichonephila clavipes]|nr:hypothetical protein TNCV_687141 [Trichonephila clavipes]
MRGVVCDSGKTALRIGQEIERFEPSPNGTAVSVANHYTRWGDYMKGIGGRHHYSFFGLSVFIHVARKSKTKAIGDEPWDFEPRSNDEDDS